MPLFSHTWEIYIVSIQFNQLVLIFYKQTFLSIRQHISSNFQLLAGQKFKKNLIEMHIWQYEAIAEILSTADVFYGILFHVQTNILYLHWLHL